LGSIPVGRILGGKAAERSRSSRRGEDDHGQNACQGGCRFGIPELIKAGGGSVINMSSNVALMGVAGRDCYTAAKGGIAAITRSLAVAYAPRRVRVNAIAPSATMTERVKKLVAGNAALTRLADSHLLGLIEPDDIASTALYLASDESRMVTGQVLPVDSGVTIS
jgi:NAD(P)-dependent dehydrogenase (short-subunit alcohol dehydrogenase family)